MRLVRIRAVLGAGVLATVAVAATSAVFSDTQTVTGNGFTTGTLTLSLSTSSALFNVTNMAPGDVSYAPLTVTNSGSLALTYTMSSSATNADTKDLRSSLTAEVKVVASTCNSTTFAASSTTAAAAVTGIQNLAVSSARGLAAAAAEVLCFKVALPSTTGNALQGATTTATFTFAAL